MGHFAKVINGKVTDIIVADQDFFETFIDNTPGKWLQTSYNTQGGIHSLGGEPLRKNYAGIGYDYDITRDAFIPPKPYLSWILNEDSCLWEAPTSYPTDGNAYSWDEENKTWKQIQIQSLTDRLTALENK